MNSLACCSQYKGLSQYVRRASWLCIDPSPPEAERQACDSQSQKARSCCTLRPRDGMFHQTVSRLPVANHIFLGSWMADACQACCSLISSPEKTHCTPEPAVVVHPDNQAVGLGKWIRCTAHLGQCAHQAPGHLSCSDLGRAQKAQLNPVCALVGYPRTWVA